MKRHIAIWIFVFLISCSHGVPTLVEEPDCTTSIEGYYRCFNGWIGPCPAMVLMYHGNLAIFRGEILSVDQESVVFDRSSESVFFNPKPKRYRFDEIETLIDDKGNVIAGTIPKRFSVAPKMEFVIRAEEKFELEFEPNEHFSYCIPPGKYKLEMIRCAGYGKYRVDESGELPNIIVDVKPDSANYLGSIYLDIMRTDAVCSFSYEWEDVTERTAMVPAGYGALGAALGFVITGLASYANLPDSLEGRHILFFCQDEDYVSPCKSPLRNCVLQIGY